MYVLRSETTGRFYVGATGDLERRLSEHNSGQTTSMRNRGPWTVVYREEFADIKAAKKRELRVKSWKSRRSIEQLIEAQR